MTTNPTPEALAAEYRSSMSREVLHAWATDVQATIRTLSAELAAAIESNTALMVEAGTLHSMGVADLNKIQALTAERDSLRERLAACQQAGEFVAKAGDDLLAEVTPLRNEVEALRAEVERLTTKWQAIETAPKDGGAILVSEGHFCYCVEWNEEYDWWVVDDNKLGPFRLRGASPTHWMPLPHPPVAEGV
jgi:hypothetical protein